MLPSSFLLIFEARKDLQPSCLMASPVRRNHQDLRPPLRPIGEVNRPGTTTTSKTLLKLLNPRPHRDGRTFRDYNPRKTLLVLLNPRPHRGGRTFRDYNQGKTLLVLLNPRSHRSGRSFRNHNSERRTLLGTRHPGDTRRYYGHAVMGGTSRSNDNEEPK